MAAVADTIAAIATAPGSGAVGIVRIAGPAAFGIADAIFHSPSIRASDARSHRIVYGQVTDPSSGERLDDALLLTFRAPHSYTGDDAVELSCHGGAYLLSRVLRAALDAGARLARPGEFTYRAFLNGRLDLTQAEAVADLIEARSDQALRAANRLRAGP
ncbi:MAG: tRNA uridine-5-carboxymethylaminomethyl(34) synthesis GTPase MnmE, partial [Armatimonadetes bacterium]|nr:tRNA uridine-5-carboxymethylaminomethyl(34) synthesis GTPase MnmE [Armatimonadota bacterium]